MTVDDPVFIDSTMLLRWKHLAPVGIVRLERMLASHLRFHSALPRAEYVVWDAGYRPATPVEERALDDLLSGHAQEFDSAVQSIASVDAVPGRKLLPKIRRAGLRSISHLPGHLQPFAEQAAWSFATLGVESVRHARRSWRDRTPPIASGAPIRHRVDFGRGGDLVALGLGWEYIDHEAMYLLRRDAGVRIHMPAFDVIPITMPQMNAGQSHLVHRYYAEMAHYADSITSISLATAAALRTFYEAESLPQPHLATNQLPAFALKDEEARTGPQSPKHRFAGKRFILSVSTIEVRKNHLLLAKIWTECIREGVDMPILVLVGRLGWDINELFQWVAHAPELDGKVFMVSDVEDDELVELYRDALFTVFPSRVEGWGLPITESLSYGTPCIHSTDPAQAEASQGVMPALHPDDFLSWKAEIIRLLRDQPYADYLRELIATKYVRRTTSEYCADFEAILTERRRRRAT